MATVNKDFKIKSGLIVEGTNATVNGNQILTENASDTYILSLIGGETLVKSVGANLSVDNAGQLSLDEVGIANDLAGTRLYSDGSTLNVDVEGIYDDMVNNGIATTSDISNAISTEVTDRNNAISTAKGEAITASENYTDGEITTALTTAQGYANTAEDNANGYTDNAISGEVTNRNNAIDTAITNLNLSGTYDALGAADQALTDANTYTDGEIAALVDSAPALLDTLNELAAAIADNPNYATDMATSLSNKQDTLTAGNGINIVGNTIATSVGLGLGNNLAGAVEINRLVVDNWYDAAGAASTAEGNANDYTDTAITNLNLGSTYDAYGAASTAESNANDYTDNAINALSTSDIEEGSNQYFTSSRARTSIANMLTTASLTNITITGDDLGGLTITAENGVADSTTSDLAEGSNLYFTDQRVLDAVDNSTITPAVVSINNYRKEEATQQYVQNPGIAMVHSFAYPYESVKYLVRVVGWVSGVKHSQLSEILMTVDGNNNIAMTEYGIIHTSTNPLATFSADDSNNQFTLTANLAVGGCEVIAAATMLSWAD